MRINNNLMAMNTHRQLGINSSNGAKSIEKLSSGYRINRAGDDAAGLAISEKMRAQIRGLNMASKNSQDGISLIQTAEGALNETHDILQRMRELAVQAANDTNVTADREQIQKEINQLTSEINRVGNTTEFNTMKLLDGSKMKALKSTAVGESLVTAGNVTVIDPASGFTATGEATIKKAIGSVKVDATGDFGSKADSAGSTIEISKTSTGYTVNLKGGSTSVGTFSATDTIVANASGDFVYDNHGVSFTITAAKDASITAGSSVKITEDSAGATSYALASDWNIATGTGVATVSMTGGITFAQTDDNKDLRYVKISGDSATVTVSLMTGTGTAATTLHSDVFAISASSTFSYDAHGVSFDLALTVTAGFTFSANVSLTAQLAVNTTYAATDYNDNALKFQVGSNENQSMSLEIGDMRSTALGITATSAGSGFTSAAVVTDGTSNTNTEFALNVSTSADAGNAVTKLNAAIESVSSERAKLGSVQNRLEHTIKNLDTSAENLQASESRIRDVDMAKEMMSFTKNNILQQAAQAMLAQANQAPQGVLQLLR